MTGPKASAGSLKWRFLEPRATMSAAPAAGGQIEVDDEVEPCQRTEGCVRPLKHQGHCKLSAEATAERKRQEKESREAERTKPCARTNGCIRGLKHFGHCKVPKRERTARGGRGEGGAPSPMDWRSGPRRSHHGPAGTLEEELQQEGEYEESLPGDHTSSDTDEYVSSPRRQWRAGFGAMTGRLLYLAKADLLAAVKW